MSSIRIAGVMCCLIFGSCVGEFLWAIPPEGGLVVSSKDNEFNDPLLEQEALIETEQAEVAKEALEARGNTPLEENKIPEKPLGKEAVLIEASPSKPSTPPMSAKTSPSVNNTSKNPPQKGVLVDTELNAIVNFGEESDKEMHPEDVVVIPRWNPQDPRKGFKSIDEEGVYHYEEDTAEGERQYSGDYKVVPKNSNYKRGLLYVTSDGSYVYRGTESDIEGSVSVRFAQLPPLPFENELGITYEMVYGTQSIGLVLMDYDWLSFKKFGHWVISIGTGFGQVEGPGRFVDDGSEAQERYTLYVLLNHISFVYRFQYSTHPWFVPYFSGGAVPAILAERRDDNERNKSKFIPAAQASGGVRFNIGGLDTYGSATLDAEYGVNNMWLDVELKRVQSFDSKIDISSNLINLGLGFDF